MEETLKEIMGDAFKEGMSSDDIKAFFKNQVLSSGEYENKGKSAAEKKQLSDKIADLQKQLQDKMTDDEKKAQSDQATQQLIEDLKKQLQDSKASQSKMSAISLLAEAKITAGIKDGDKEFDKFVDEISFEDSEKTDRISKYVSSIVKNAYEAGKAAAIKDKLGKFGNFKNGSEGDSDEGNYGKQLAKRTQVDNKNAVDFFAKK